MEWARRHKSIVLPLFVIAFFLVPAALAYLTARGAS